MGLFLRDAEPQTQERDISLSQYAAMWTATLPYSPTHVSVATALANAASAACVDVLAGSISALPLDGVLKSGDRRVPLEPAPSLIAQPSGLVEQDVWLYQISDSLETDGNAFGEITTYGVGGLPTSIEPIDAGIVTNRRVERGVPTVAVLGEDRQLWPYGDLWHLPGRLVRAGSPFAESPVKRAQATIGTAVAAREFGGRFFGDNAAPSAILSNPDPTLTKEQVEGAKRSFMNALRGNREPAAMGSGWTYTPITVNPNDSQFIELMRFCIEEACRFWRVPPSLVYSATSGQNVTYANVSQADLAYLKHSLESRLVRIEKALTRLLPRPQFARFNRNAFLRVDPITRSEIQDRRLRNKTTSVNEVRAQEDEEPFDGAEFDEPGIPGDSGRDLSAAEAVQKVYLGVANGVITPDEGRQIINDAGGDLPVPGPFPTEAPPNA